MSFIVRSLALLILLGIVLLSMGSVRKSLRETSWREIKQLAMIALAIYFLFSLTMTLRGCSGDDGAVHGGEGGIRTLEGR